MDHRSCTFHAFPNTLNQASKPPLSCHPGSSIYCPLLCSLSHSLHITLTTGWFHRGQVSSHSSVKHTVRTNPGDSMVPSPSPGAPLLPAGGFWWRKEERLKEIKVTKVRAPRGRKGNVSSVTTTLLCCSVFRINQRIPLDTLAPTVVEFAVVCVLAQYRRTFILTL